MVQPERRVRQRLYGLVLAGLLLGSGSASLAADGKTDASDPEIQAEMVWIRQANRGNELVYSALQNNAWNSPVRLSDEGRTNLVPTIGADKNGRTFVVWSVLAGGGSSLYYALLRDAIIAGGPAKIETGLNANMAAALAIDYDGIPWLVWSGNNGSTSDIYYSSWQDNSWQKPEKVHAPNSVPDILPRAKVGRNGSVLVSWSQIGPDGYVTLTREVHAGKAADSADLVDSPATDQKEASADPLACVKMLPVDGGRRDKAVLLSRCRKNAPPVQVRFGSEGKVEYDPGF